VRLVGIIHKNMCNIQFIEKRLSLLVNYSGHLITCSVSWGDKYSNYPVRDKAEMDIKFVITSGFWTVICNEALVKWLFARGKSNYWEKCLPRCGFIQWIEVDF